MLETHSNQTHQTVIHQKIRRYSVVEKNLTEISKIEFNHRKNSIDINKQLSLSVSSNFIASLVILQEFNRTMMKERQVPFQPKLIKETSIQNTPKTKQKNNHSITSKLTNDLQKSYEKVICQISNLFPFTTYKKAQDNLFITYVDFKSQDLVNKILNKLTKKGLKTTQIISSFGKTFINIKINEDNKQLLESLRQIRYQILKPRTPFEIDSDIIYGVVKISTIYLNEHEQIIDARKQKLKIHLQTTCNAILPSIIACQKSLTLIDGHHRLNIYKQKNIQQIPVLLINYDNPNIITHPQRPIPKQVIIRRAANQQNFPPKSTKHMIRDKQGVDRPLIAISVAIDQTTRQCVDDNFQQFMAKIQNQHKEGNSESTTSQNEDQFIKVEL